LPSITTRSLIGVAQNCFNSSIDIQCVVARLPSSKPAAPKSSAPVQTDVT
jgi:hypothetical protein